MGQNLIKSRADLVSGSVFSVIVSGSTRVQTVGQRVDPLANYVIGGWVITPLRLLHLSFRNFLLDPQKRGKSPFWVVKRCSRGVCALWSVTETGCNQRIISMWLLEDDDLATEKNSLLMHFIKQNTEIFAHRSAATTMPADYVPTPLLPAPRLGFRPITVDEKETHKK